VVSHLADAIGVAHLGSARGLVLDDQCCRCSGGGRVFHRRARDRYGIFDVHAIGGVAEGRDGIFLPVGGEDDDIVVIEFTDGGNVLVRCDCLAVLFESLAGIRVEVQEVLEVGQSLCDWVVVIAAADCSLDLQAGGTAGRNELSALVFAAEHHGG